MNYICSGCNKEMNIMDIAIAGPDIMFWCENCRGVAKFVNIARKYKMMEMLNSDKYSSEFKLTLIELWELIE